jgi:UDP-N-acetylmuramate dehydrogenase
VQWTLAQGWPGLENLSLIPGTVGAAPIQNIGAYGLEVAERFHSLTAWDFEKRAFFTVDRNECRFAYRDSLFKQEGWHLNGRMAITSVVFRLPKPGAPTSATPMSPRNWPPGIAAPTPREVADAIVAVRQRKLPDPARRRTPAASSTTRWSMPPRAGKRTWPRTLACRATRSPTAASSWPPAG